MSVRRLGVVAVGLLVSTACGTSELDLGHDPPEGDLPASQPPLAAADSPLPADKAAPASTWEWVNPAPQGNRIRGMGGSADADVWLVGDGNTVLHWDGSRWLDRHGSIRGLDLYSVWSSGPDDAWLIGDAGVTYRRESPNAQRYGRRSNPGGGAVLHYDGTDWKADPQIGDRWAHAIWGADGTHVFALLEQGDVGRFDGTGWTVTPSPANAVLREIWGASPTNVWAVGDGGTIAHFDGLSWTTVPRASGDPKSDPAAPQNAYYGLWGTSATDVWAVFFDPSSRRNLPTSCEQALGFSHWDGVTWKVTQTLYAPCSDLEDLTPQTNEPSRLGHQLWGGNGGQALAIAYRSFSLLAYDGTSWAWDEELSWDDLHGSAGSNRLFNTGIRTVWGRPAFGALFAAGEGGVLFRADITAPPQEQLSEVFPSFRQAMRSIVTTGSDVWAIASYDHYESTSSDPGGDLARWTSGGWSRVNVYATVGDEACEVAVSSLSSTGENDLWISGGYSVSCEPPSSTQRAPVLMHWNGAGWTTIPLPEEEQALYWPLSSNASSRSVWSPKGSNTPWLLQRGFIQSGELMLPPALYRLEGGAWTKISLPDGFEPMAIGGSSNDDVWIATSRKLQGESERTYAMFHGSGATFAAVPEASGVAWREILAAAKDDLWLRAPPTQYGTRSTTRHWDGKTWTDRSELNADAIWPAGEGKAYVISHDDDGANFWVPVDTRYELGYWDGIEKRRLGETSARVTSLVGAGTALWVAGEEGATLRFAFPKPPR